MKREIVLVATLMCVWFLNVRFVAADVDKHTVGLWLFDEGSGDVVHDSSGRDHHGKIVGKAEWMEGKFGKALKVGHRRSSWVEIPDAADLKLETFSLEAWVNMREDPNRHQIVISKRVGDLRSYTLNVQKGTSLIVGGFTEKKMWTNCVGQSDLIGKWHHLAVTYDKETLRVYVDGVEENACPKGMLTPDVNGAALRIGSGLHAGQHVNGTIDEVRLSSVARSAAEIQQSVLGQMAQSVDPTSKLALTWGSIKAGT